MSWLGLLTEFFERRPGQKLSFVLAFISIGLYVQLAYFTPRSDSALLISCFTLLFAFYLMLSKSVLSFKTLLVFGIIYRLLFVFSTPALSDDFYRFFWDGMLIVNRINPFQYLPKEIIENPAINIPEINAGLYALLNSPEYYTVYPPICQFIFWISAWISGGNIHFAVLTMKIIFMMAELGSIYLIWNLLKIHKGKKELTLLYILNPLVIVELVGNIHFEAIMIFAVLLAVYAIAKRKWIGGAFGFALAIIAKLTPLLLLPFLLKRLKLKKSISFYIVTLSVASLAFLPFMGSELVHGLGSSIGLYFQKFEFNASIFYIVRAFGFWLKGYDVIQTAGIWLGMITFLSIVFLAFFQDTKTQNLTGILVWPLLIYFAFATIVHPWYVTPLIAFCLFSNYRFPIVWSYTIFLSYLGYSVDGFQEQTWVLLVEYLSVFGVMLYELLKYKDLVSTQNPWLEIKS
jgi:hypothetical protein